MKTWLILFALVPAVALVPSYERGAAAAERSKAAPAIRMLPRRLVGTWVSAGGAAELVYRFRRNGTYAHAGVLLQQRAGGMFSFEIGAVGHVTVRGNRLTLRPQRGYQALHDPDVPSRSWRRPIDRRPEHYRFAVRGSRLWLDDGSQTLVYRRR